jgi:SAM-dependent methyltransferase
MAVPSTERVVVGQKVRSFYEQFSYPGYDNLDSLDQMIRRASENPYVRMLDEQIPIGARIVDVGCGTGQLPLLLSVVGRKVVGADFSYASLSKGNAFRQRCDTRNVVFAQMDIFNLALRPRTFDYAFCVGVLHHTADPRGGFSRVCELVKPGGYVVLGLYNTYGRLLLDLRRVVFRMTGGRLRQLDFLIRGRRFGEHRKKIWYADQYEHPHESKHSVDEVLGWFAEEGLEYVNAVPKIRIGEYLTPSEILFDPHREGSRFDHMIAQLGWVFTQGKDGGFFLMMGKKPV